MYKWPQPEMKFSLCATGVSYTPVWGMAGGSREVDAECPRPESPIARETQLEMANGTWGVRMAWQMMSYGSPPHITFTTIYT